MRRLNYRRKAVILASLTFLLLVIVYIAGIVISEDAVTGSFLDAGESPSLEHLFGTDALGRDLFLRTIKGLSLSITVGLTASALSGILAILVGLGVATGSKAVDAFINWIIDLVMSVPHTIVIILVSFALGKGMTGMVAGIAATHWCTLARLVRGEILELRSRQYIAYSRRNGKSGRWIFVHHMMPHLIPQFTVSLILMFPHAILHEASVSFLGFGLSPEKSSIGIILSESMRYLSAGMWWGAVLPGVTLLVTVLLFDRLGNYLLMILDPYSAEE